MTRGKTKLWWTLDTPEEMEFIIEDPTPHFEVINEEEVVTGLLDASGNEIPVAEKQLGFLVFGED